jgi:hypothetical protein
MNPPKGQILAFSAMAEMLGDFEDAGFAMMDVVRAHLWQAASGCKSKGMDRAAFQAEVDEAWNLMERLLARGVPQ